MAKPDSTWRVLEHGPLEQLADNLYRVEGAVPNMSLRRVMTIARRSDGALLIHNAIALAEPAQRAVEALGTLRFLVVPSRWHRLDAPAYKARYPELRVFTPRAGIAAVRELVAVDGTYEEFPSDDELRLVTLPGLKEREGALLVRSSDGLSLVLNDCVMNMDRRPDLLGDLFTRLLGSAPGPRVSRLSKLALVADRKALRAQLEHYAEDPALMRLIVSHDKVATGPEAARALREAATYL